MRLGIVGVDTSHAVEFARIMNCGPDDSVRVHCSLPVGSTTVRSSIDRIDSFRRELAELSVMEMSNIDDLLDAVDGVLIETNDGTMRLEQTRQVLDAGMPVFVDKPIAASWDQVVELETLVRSTQSPVFSASAIRYLPGVEAAGVERPFAAVAFAPYRTEPSHASLYWYGVHGFELLFEVFGTGCEEVQWLAGERAQTVIARWDAGRTGTYIGLADGPPRYGGASFHGRGVTQFGAFEGFEVLVGHIREFFQTGEPPVAFSQTVEVHAAMEAAHRSLGRDAPVPVVEVMADITPATNSRH